jgi:hypothetical protein
MALRSSWTANKPTLRLAHDGRETTRQAVAPGLALGFLSDVSAVEFRLELAFAWRARAAKRRGIAGLNGRRRRFAADSCLPASLDGRKTARV